MHWPHFPGCGHLGGAAASLYGLGYGHHDPAPHACFPSSPLPGRHEPRGAGDDAFFLFAVWEFMSLASWALSWRIIVNRATRSGLRLPGDGKLRTLALLLAFGLLAGPAGDYGFAAIRAAQHTRTWPCWC